MTVFKALLARTTEVGSRNLVWACINDTPSGSYVSACEVTEYAFYVLLTPHLLLSKKFSSSTGMPC